MRQFLFWSAITTTLLTSCSVNPNYENENGAVELALNVNAFDISVSQNRFQTKALDGAGGELVESSDFYYYILNNGDTNLSDAVVTVEPGDELVVDDLEYGQEYDIYVTTTPYDLSASTPSPSLEFPTREAQGEFYEGMATTAPLVLGSNDASINANPQVFQVEVNFDEAYSDLKEEYEFVRIFVTQGAHRLPIHPDDISDNEKPIFFLPSTTDDLKIELIANEEMLSDDIILKSTTIAKEDAIAGKHFVINIVSTGTDLETDIVIENEWDEVPIPL